MKTSDVLGVVRGVCIAICLLGPVGWASAQAPPAQAVTPENSQAACSDGIDNDGDGYIDCADPDCQQLTLCQAPPLGTPPPPSTPPPPTYQPPPPAYQPPPSYQAPTYQPYMPPTYAQSTEQPPFGLVTGIIGAALLIAGLGMLGGSASVWVDANCKASTLDNPNSGTCKDNNLRNEGIVLDVFGGIFFIVGVVMTPVGFSQFSTYLHWKKTHPKTTAFVPSLQATQNGAVGGLKFTF